MISYGFFNSINNDRLYNAESFNTYFEGLISSNGIFENVRGSFIVSAADSGLAVNVATGKALVNSCWVVNDSVETITLDTAHNLLPRYDKIGLLWDETNRNITLRKVTGTPASSPVKPAPTRTATQYEIILAYVYIAPNATSLSAANITDCRYDTNICGVVTGLIDQVDTSTLYNQYLVQFGELRIQMEEWEAQQKTQFKNWFDTLTEQLNVNTYIEELRVSYNGDNTTTIFALPNGYKEGDIVDVYLNNIILMPGVDYTISGSNIVKNSAVRTGNTIAIRVLKSKIGYQQLNA